MDMPTVIQLSCQAAESVLRFRAVTFTNRPVIDLQSFRAAITTQIEEAVKENQHHPEVPLAEVLTYAGIGAAEAVRQWNGISSKQNHMGAEWFRNCVCNLVGGVVTDVGTMAFTNLKLNASMCIQADEYDPFGVPGGPAAHPAQNSPLHTSSGGQASGKGKRAETEEADEASAVPSPRSHSSAAPSAAPESPVNRPAKRTRLVDARPARPSAPAVPRLPTAPRGPPVRWTQQELDIIKDGKERGDSWETICSMVPRHSRVACETRFQMIKGNRIGFKPMDADSSPKSSPKTPAAGKAGQRAKGAANPAGPSTPTGTKFGAINKNAADDLSQSDGEE